MNILVTGASGQLGKSIRSMSSKYPDLDFVFVTRHDLDITDLDLTLVYFTKQSFDYCINCAAYTTVDQAETQSKEAYAVNSTGPKNLAIACGQSNTVLIHISTDFVFDGKKETPYVETDSCSPLNVYGKSKCEGELHIQKIMYSYFIVRTSWLFSEFGSNFVKTMISLSSTNKELSIVNDQYGCPTYAEDLVHFIICLTQSGNRAFGIYHFCNSGIVSWFQFAQAILSRISSDLFLHPISSLDYKTLAVRPDYSVLSNTKAQALLQNPIPHWDEGLEKVIGRII